MKAKVDQLVTCLWLHTALVLHLHPDNQQTIKQVRMFVYFVCVQFILKFLLFLSVTKKLCSEH